MDAARSALQASGEAGSGRRIEDIFDDGAGA